MYCQSCGEEVSNNASYCDSCGEPIDSDEDTHEHTEPETETITSTSRNVSPLWSVAVLSLTWLFFLFGFGGLQSGGTVIGGLATLAVIASIPILWLDARAAIRAGELSTSRPIYIVIAVYLLYLLTMPIYVGYRLYKRSQQT